MNKLKKVFLVICLSLFASNVYAANPTSVTVVSKQNKVNYANFNYALPGRTLGQSRFYISDSEGNKAEASCVAPSLEAPKAGKTYTNVQKVSSNKLLKSIYYGLDGYSSNKVSRTIFSKSHNNAANADGEMILTHVAAAKAYSEYLGSDRYNWSRSANSLLINDVNSYLSAIDGLQTPADYDAYIVIPNDNSQIFVYLAKKAKEEPKEEKNNEENNTNQSENNDTNDNNSTTNNTVNSNTTNNNTNNNTTNNNNNNTNTNNNNNINNNEINIIINNIINYRSGYGKVILEKNATAIIDGSAVCYNVTGSIYEVFNKTTNEKVGELIVNANGVSNLLDLKAGFYYLKEKTAPAGYKLDENVYDFEIKVNQTTVVSTIGVEESYKLIYNANGGENAPNTSYGYGDDCCITLSDKIPVRKGYKFLGWSKDKNATTPDSTYVKGFVFCGKDDLELFAVWQKVNDSESGTIPSDMTNPQTGVEDYALPTAGVATASLALSMFLKKKKIIKQF